MVTGGEVTHLLSQVTRCPSVERNISGWFSMSQGQWSSDELSGTSTIACCATGDSVIQLPPEETAASGSKEFPCRAFHPLSFPRDGHEPHNGALGSQDFPLKRVVTEMGGVYVMGPWLRLRSEDALHLSQLIAHINPECSLITEPPSASRFA